jgi:hypothetical protein
MSISQIINSNEICIEEVNFVESLAPPVVQFIAERFPPLCTINLHYLLHMGALIRMFG